MSARPEPTGERIVVGAALRSTRGAGDSEAVESLIKY